MLFVESAAAHKEMTGAGRVRAIGLLTEAARLFRQANEPTNEAVSLSGIGDICLELGRADSGLVYFGQALTIWRQVGDREEEGGALFNIARLLANLGQPDSALVYYRQALAVKQELGDRAGKGTALNNIGTVYRGLGQPDSALAYFWSALAVKREVKDRAGEGNVLNSIGVIYHDRGRPDSALAYYRQALAVNQEVRDRVTEGRTLNDLGGLYLDLGQPDSALAYYRQSLMVRREVGDRAGAATTLNNIGVVYLALGRSDSALAYDCQALAVDQEIRDRAGEGKALNNIGVAYHRLGRPDSALTYYRRALAVRREVRDRVGEGTVLNNIALTSAESGRPDSALAYDRQALAVNREVRDRAAEGQTLNNIGTVYSTLGRPDSASAYYWRALVVKQEVRDRAGEGTVLNNIGGVNLALGRLDSALAYYWRAMAIKQEVRDPTGEGHVLSSIGEVYRELGRPDSALAYHRHALMVMQEAKDRANEGRELNNIGISYADSNEPDSALVYYRQSLMIRREVGDGSGEATTLSNIGALYHESPAVRDLTRAVAYYDSAAALSATIREQAGGDANSISFAESKRAFFIVWPLAWLARATEVGEPLSALAALAAAERGRAQALLSLMRGTSAEMPPGADLAAEGRRLVQGVQRSGAALLSYLVTDDTLLIWFAPPKGELTLTAAAVSQDSITRLVRAWRAGLGVDEASGQAQLAVRGSPPLETPTRSGTAPASAPLATSTEAGVRLAALLLPPTVLHSLGSGAEVVIVPHGPLTVVPFAALPLTHGERGSGGLFGGRFALRYAPSLASVAQAESRAGLPAGPARTAALKRSLVVGNPSMPRVTRGDGSQGALAPLPGAEAEGRWVAGRFGTTALTGPRASESVVRGRLAAASVVHLATHGYAYASEARARSSFVALAPDSSQDGLLTVGEVLDDPALRLNADLVVLSACQTGLGDLKQAEGTVGLQRAFLAKGARSVLVSLWSVSDEATSLLMKGFYTHWLGDRDNPRKAEALRRAQMEVRGKPGSRFYEPRYWAAFQLVGAR